MALYKKGIIIAAGLTLALAATSSIAATQGSLGSTSTGATVVSITIPAMVRITGLSDITLTPSDITTDVPGNTTACIYSNRSAVPGGYAITATSANGLAGNCGGINDAAGSNTFCAGSTSPYLPYDATWNDGTTTSPLTSNTKLTGQTGASQTSVTCAGGSNSTFAVNFKAADLQSVPQGTYTDTVTLLVSPT